MSFDTSHQNTGLSEGQGRPLATPKSVTKHKAPIGGCRSTPLFFAPPKHKKRELFSSLFSPKFLLFRGRILAFSERVYDCRYTCRKIVCCCLTGRSPSTVPRGGWGCRGQSPLHSPPSIKEPV